MSAITLEQAAKWCNGKIDSRYADVTFLGACNDSRKVQSGELFVALTTETRDGNDFVPAAMEAGAAAALCSRCDGDYPAIIVPDVRVALGDIARAERERLQMKVVGITGSVGKSTTKEMISLVLSKKYKTAKTPVNHNNDIGMPMAILSMPEDTEVGVLEMGMNHFKEMSYLTSIAQPDLAVIINIGTMHIEHLGSREGILHAKMEILEGLRPEGKMVFSGDESLLWNLRQSQPKTPVYFGTENMFCDVLGTDVQDYGDKILFQASAFGESCQIMLPVEGRHLAVYALAAVAVGRLLEVPMREIAEALAEFQNLEGRMELLEEKGFSIIKDCYNAGPESMAASLSVLGKRAGRRIAVLGDMLELGVGAPAEHYRIGRIAAMNADLIFALGPNAERVVSGALTGGMPPRAVNAYSDMEKLTDDLIRRAKPGDVLLFKGSRGMKMESVLERFLKEK